MEKLCIFIWKTTCRVFYILYLGNFKITKITLILKSVLRERSPFRPALFYDPPASATILQLATDFGLNLLEMVTKTLAYHHKKLGKLLTLFEHTLSWHILILQNSFISIEGEKQSFLFI